jgi:predicted Zn-dependent protease with MMP-like domain
VREAVASLPPELLRRVENVEIVVERRPTARDRRDSRIRPGDTLFGLYHGIPLTQRGQDYNLVLPDRISIYREPIESVCRDDDDVRAEVRKTVLHELGHYFGMSDGRLDELGMG